MEHTFVSAIINIRIRKSCAHFKALALFINQFTACAFYCNI